MHGGGYILGRAIQDDRLLGEYAKSLNCVIVSVDYRLAPAYPFPAPLENCYAALKWVYEHHHALKIDPKRIAIEGLSVGAGLAAGLT